MNKCRNCDRPLYSASECRTGRCANCSKHTPNGHNIDIASVGLMDVLAMTARVSMMKARTNGKKFG